MFPQSTLTQVDFAQLELRVLALVRFIRHREGMFSGVPFSAGAPPYYIELYQTGAAFAVDLYGRRRALQAAPSEGWNKFADRVIEEGAWVEFDPTSASDWAKVLTSDNVGVRQSVGPAFPFDPERLHAANRAWAAAIDHHPV